MYPLLQKSGLALAAVWFANFAYAHTDVGTTAGFIAGLAHPLGGLDHVLAMLAVGLWAALLGGRAMVLVPGAFVGTMMLGSILGMAAIGIPAVELGILGSTLVLGALIALNARMSTAIGMGIVAAFALFHGHAHGAEMPALASGMLYGLGFAVATASLHILGIGLGLLSGNVIPEKAIRAGGIAIMAAGTVLFALG